MCKHLFLSFIIVTISLKGICNNTANAFGVKNITRIDTGNAVKSINSGVSLHILSIVGKTMASDAIHAQPKHQKLKAIILAITLGVFGVHRIYLGTSPFVPIAYTLTLGGFGILPIIDIVNILFSKNIDKYKNNRQFFMWLNNNKQQ